MAMRKIFCILLLLLSSTIVSWAQANTRRLPSIINHPSLNLYAPYVSHDGNALLFISDDGEDRSLTVFYTSRETDWAEPKVLPKNINHRIVYLRGYALSGDGKKLYFTSAKSPVVGGYDIMTSDLKGSTWSEPQNLSVPINSKTNEGCPSLTPDGNTIYFMRCDRMDQNKADGCKLFVSRKKANGQWEEPSELPSNINTGNSQTPRIMADGETLIFSSDKMATNKGGMDLYTTKLINGNWSEPKPLDFVNTEKDDQFVSVSALGRYLLKEAPGARKTSELVEFLIPADLRPKGAMKVEGTVLDADNAPVPSYVSITDLQSNKRVYNGRPNADGSYIVYLLEGTRYEISVDPEQSNITYFAKQYDLTEKTPQRERLNVVLKEPVAGDELLLDVVAFKPNSFILETSSEVELKRLSRVMKANAHLKFEIQVMLSGFKQDSVMSDPDLTEIAIDSLTTQIEAIDGLGQSLTRDTLVVTKSFHNDRTLKQAEAIREYLVAQGVKKDQLTIFGNAIPAALPGSRKLTIKVVAMPK